MSTTLIRIHASCDLFSVSEIVEENKAERRLRQIKTVFLQSNFLNKGVLKVSTMVVNPEINFRPSALESRAAA